MKQFIVDRHTTPNTPTLEQVPTEKIPIYDDRAAVTADLANLSVGQIVVTKDTGTELSQPVDVVESGNLHAVTSNAVAESLSYSTTEQKTGGVWIDGKPIYRKVIEINGIIDSNGVATGCPAGTLIIKLDILAQWNSTSWNSSYALAKLVYQYGDNSGVPVVAGSKDVTVIMRTTESSNKYVKAIIIEYVKPSN